MGAAAVSRALYSTMDDLQSSEEATFVVEEVSQIIKEVSSVNLVLIVGSLRCVVGNIIAAWSRCSHDVDVGHCFNTSSTVCCFPRVVRGECSG